MKTKPTPPPRRPDGTLNALQAALGLSKRRVSDLLSQGMPDTVEAALAWRAARENDDSAAELRRRRIALLREQERLAKSKADEADGLLVSRAECQQEWTRIACALAAMLNHLEREIPQICYGLPLSQSLPRAKAEFHKVRTAFANCSEEYWRKHPEGKPQPKTSKP